MVNASLSKNPTDAPVSIFIPSLNGGGAERAMLQLTEGLLANGHRVHLVVATDKGSLKTLVPAGVTLVSCNAKRTAGAILPLLKYLRRERPKALFSTIPHANLIAIFANLLSGTKTPLIVRESNSPITEAKASFGRQAVHHLVPFMYPLANGVIAVSEGVGSQLASLEKKPGAFNIKVLATPVISDSVLRNAEQPADISWLQNPAAPIILGAGRLVPAKGFDVLIKAFAAVKKRVDVNLIILGEGSLKAELQALAESLGVASSVHFPGFMLNPFPYFKRANIFVLSSRFEGMPNVLLQALALGTPVVATDCESGPRECLMGGKLGKLVAVDDAAAMAEAIVGTLQEKPDGAIAALIRETYATNAAAKGYLDFALASGRH